MKYMTNEKMKKLLFFCYLIIGSFVMSCSQRETPDILEKVERCIEVYPDSALLLLNQLPYPEKLHGKQRADYALLLTQARDKNYLDSLQSDSLIKIAVDYYQDGKDKVKKGKSLFYYGKVMAFQDSVDHAMKIYLDAEKVLEGTQEFQLQATLQEYIGYLNNDQGMYEVAVDNYRKAIYYSGKASNRLKMAYGYRNIAYLYIARENNDSARWYAERGISLLNGDSTAQALPSFLQILGIVEKSEGNIGEAINYFSDAIKYEKDPNVVIHYYLSLGNLYLDKGQFDKAIKCFETGISSRYTFTQAGAYNSLFLLEKRRKDYVKALFYKEKSDSLLNVAQNQSLKNQLLVLQRKYERDKLIMENKQIEQAKRAQLYFLLSIILFIIVIGGISFLLLKKMYRERFKKNIRIIRENEQTINHYVYELEQLRQKENIAIENSKEKIGKLNQKILLLTNENKAIRENICVNAVFLLDQLKKNTLIVKRMSKNERIQVFQYFDLLFGNFVSRLKNDYELTENNIMLASLIKIGFTSKELMFVFDCEMNSVFRMKQRLKDKLHLVNDNNLEEFIALY